MAIPALSSATNPLVSSAANQLVSHSATCVSLVSTSTNGGHPLSIISANQNQQSTMSWTTQGTPIQFAPAQRPNGATICSFVPQQAIYQMPNDATTILPQTMLITQPPSRPPDPNGAGGAGTVVTAQTAQTGAATQLAGQTAAGPIVQIIQTPNGPAQLISSSPAGLKAPTYTNLITSSSVVNTVNSSTSSSSNSKSTKQILPKGSKAKQSTANTCTNTTSTTNSKSSFSAAGAKQQPQTAMITTSLAGSTAPTMTSLSNINLSNLNQVGTPLMLNTGQSTGFFTSNGLFFNPMQSLPQMGQQQFIINSAPTVGNAPNNGPTNKPTNQQQTILIPSSTSSGNQLAGNQMKVGLQPTNLMQSQSSAPQLLQLPNGQVILVQAPPQPTSTDTIQLAQNYAQPMLIQQPTDGQTVSYSSGSLSNFGNFSNLSSLGNNFIITSQPSSFVNTTPMITTTICSTSSTTTTTTTTTTSKSRSRRRPPRKN